jgi:hypothetical protein
MILKSTSIVGYHYLVGGFKHLFFSIIYGLSSFPLTNSIIFQDGYCTTNQVGYHDISCSVCGYIAVMIPSRTSGRSNFSEGVTVFVDPHVGAIRQR